MATIFPTIFDDVENLNDHLDIFTGTTSLVDGKSGLVPQPKTTDINKFLSSDGTWKNVSGSGGGGEGGGSSGFVSTWSITRASGANEPITVPNAYKVGTDSSQNIFYYNGILMLKTIDYIEVGTIGDASFLIQPTFPMSVGDILTQIWTSVSEG